MDGKPVTVPSERRRNYLLLFSNSAIFGVGFSLISPVTILPVFVSYLTHSNLLIGAVPAIVQLAWSLPQLLGARHFERLIYKRFRMVAINVSGRGLFTLFGVAVIFLATQYPTLILVLFFVAIVCFRGFNGFTTAGWLGIFEKVMPARERGRFIGASQAAGGLMGAVGVWTATRIIGDEAFPVGFGLSMVAAGTILMACNAILLFLAEPPSDPPARPAEPVWRVIGRVPRVLKYDRAFLGFVAGRLLVGWGTTAFSFFAVFTTRELGAGPGEVGAYTSVLLLAQTVATLGWGFVSDRFGNRALPALAGVVVLAATALAAATDNANVFYGVFILVGVAQGAFAVVDYSTIFELAPVGLPPTYVAILNLTMAPLLLPASLVAGAIVDAAGFRQMFIFAIAFAGAGVLVFGGLMRERRPRAAAGSVRRHAAGWRERD